MNKLRVLGFVAMAALGSVWWANAARAEDPAESRSAAFQAVEGAQGEQVPGGPLMVSAYGVVMALVVGYVARLGLMQRKTALEVERLSAAIQRSRGPAK